MRELTQTKQMLGFTLVELMATLVIAAVILGLGVPGMSKLLERNRLQTSADALYTTLMLTRSEAVKRNRQVIMCKSSDGATCTDASQWHQGWLVYSDTDGDSAVDPNEVMRVERGLNRGDTLYVSGGDFADEISYNTDGSASGTGTFVLCNASGNAAEGREVEVEVTGRPRLTKSTADCTP